ncbi:hypothetical protein QQ054_29400 [Oscillatoria amoena NRMC-F 0135]|nr:hypothetical protein [Oscillatoria amoena NRMC-F 0135]
MKKVMTVIGVVIGLIALGCTLTNQKHVLSHRDGYEIATANYSPAVEPGDTTVVRLIISRSNRFAKIPIWLKVASPLPNEMTVGFEPNPVHGDTAVAYFTVSENMSKQTTTTIIISGDSRTPGFPQKGIPLKVTARTNQPSMDR